VQKQQLAGLINEHDNGGRHEKTEDKPVRVDFQHEGGPPAREQAATPAAQGKFS
jgi:hypothetical protein